jgi:hypothetical protein
MANLTIGFVVCFLAFLYFIFRGDDEIAAKLLTRKPTPEEGFRRVRYVLSGFFASIFGGALLAVYSTRFILIPFHVLPISTMSKNGRQLYVVACIVLALLLIRLLQNVLRIAARKQPLPFVDTQTLRKNLGR